MQEITEKDINLLIKRHKNKKGWFDTKKSRSSNMHALNVRRIMQKAVESGAAFDNRLPVESKDYKICFNLEEKQKMLDALEDSTKRSLSDELDRHNREALIAERILLNKYAKNDSGDVFPYVMVDIQIYLIYEAFSRYQIRGEEISRLFDNINTEDIIVNNSLSKQDLKLLVEIYKEELVIRTEIYISMYYALKIGWQEIEHIYPSCSYNEMFLVLFILKVGEVLELYKTTNVTSFPYRSTRNHLGAALHFRGSIETELESLVRKSSNLKSQEYRYILKNYKIHPRGINFLVALCALADAANEYPHLRDMFADAHRSSQALAALDNNTPPSDLDIVKSTIQSILASSKNPRVTRAVADWIKQENKIFKLFGKLNRKLEKRPDLRPENRSSPCEHT